MSMDKEVVNPIVIVAVAVVLLVGVVWRAAQKPKAAQPEVKTAGHGEKINYSLADKNKSYDIGDRSRKEQRLNASSVVLEGITMSPEQTATFSGKVYRAGDMIGNCKVLDIREEEVMIERNGEIKYIKMGETLDKL